MKLVLQICVLVMIANIMLPEQLKINDKKEFLYFPDTVFRSKVCSHPKDQGATYPIRHNRKRKLRINKTVATR